MLVRLQEKKNGKVHSYIPDRNMNGTPTQKRKGRFSLTPGLLNDPAAALQDVCLRNIIAYVFTKSTHDC